MENMYVIGIASLQEGLGLRVCVCVCVCSKGPCAVCGDRLRDVILGHAGVIARGM